MTRDEILNAIEAERDRQKSEGYADELPILEWVVVITEELGEMAQAVLDYKRGGPVRRERSRRDAFVEEGVQTAAAIVAFLEDWS